MLLLNSFDLAGSLLINLVNRLSIIQNIFRKIIIYCMMHN